MNPINVCILLRSSEPLMKNICAKFKSEKEALEAVNESINKYKENPDDKSLKYYLYEDISLIDFLNGDYNFLKKKFIIEDYYMPDINHYINN